MWKNSHEKLWKLVEELLCNQTCKKDLHVNGCMLSRFSCVQFFVTLWTVAHQVPLSMGFSRQEYWSGLPCPPPRDLPDLGRWILLLLSHQRSLCKWVPWRKDIKLKPLSLGGI